MSPVFLFASYRVSIVMEGKLIRMRHTSERWPNYQRDVSARWGHRYELQKEILRNMYRHRSVIPLFLGEDHEFAPSDEAAWVITTSQNSVCDIIMEVMVSPSRSTLEKFIK